jgi:integrase
MPAISRSQDEFGGAGARGLERYEGQGRHSACALKLMALLFPRPGELRQGKTWSEFDFNTSVWTIPAERMKMRREHRRSRCRRRPCIS